MSDNKKSGAPNTASSYKAVPSTSTVFQSATSSNARQGKTHVKLTAATPAFKRSNIPQSPTSSNATAATPAFKRPNIPQSTTTQAKKNLSLADFPGESFSDDAERQIAYGRFLREMLVDCLVDKKVQEEEKSLDHQLCLLAKRFNDTIDKLDDTNQHLKEVISATEQKRLIKSKEKECTEFVDMIEKSKANEIVDNIVKKENKVLSTLETKNIDFGYDKESGHKQLLEVVNDAITVLKEVKKTSDLDQSKSKKQEAMLKKVMKSERKEKKINELKQQFENSFPKFSEALIKEASELITIRNPNDAFKSKDIVKDNDSVQDKDSQG